jgi:hypothetical protein
MNVLRYFDEAGPKRHENEEQLLGRRMAARRYAAYPG